MNKNLFFGMALMAMLMSFQGRSQTNDFYDDDPAHLLGVPRILVTGEVSNPGYVDLEKLPLRSLICKEVRLAEGRNRFIGAYRYEGYSLYDILNSFQLNKMNQSKFPPIIDLYVVITSETGEKVVLSWGEIYYPVHRHEIMIATQVARIVPTKSKELWPLPEVNKLVVATDLVTERNISRPVKIEVLSYSGNYEINKGMSPMVSPEIRIKSGDKQLAAISGGLPENSTVQNYSTVFYGRGMGIHGISDFKGVALKDALKAHFPVDKAFLQEGLVVVAALDGYRAVYSFSEIFNRSDQEQVLLVDEGLNDGGRFRLFPAADFFSDRAVKSVMEIRVEKTMSN